MNKQKMLLILSITLIIALVLTGIAGLLAQIFTSNDLNETLNLIIIPILTVETSSLVMIISNLFNNDKKE